MKSVLVDSSLPMRLLVVPVLLLASLLSLPRAVHSFAVVSHSSRLQQYESVVRSSVSSLPPLFYSFASEHTDNTGSRLLERSLTDENDDHVEEHAAAVDVVAPKYTSMPAGVEPHIQVIESHADLQEYLAAEDDRLIMIKFHAAWCKSCKRFGLHFNKLVSQKGDWVNPKTLEIVKQGQVRVASIEWTACTALSRSMGITRLPTVQFFHNGQMVGGVVAGPTKFAQVQQALDHYLSLQSPELDFEAEMERGKTLMEQESGRIFNNQPAVQPHATTTTTTREHSKQVVMSSSSSTATEEAMLVTNESIIINNNASSASTKQESHVVDQRHRASWWNIKGVLAQRRARRAALQDARP